MEDRGLGFDEIESLIYRLFGEKQLALALMALILVANLISAQFLLLRMSPPRAQSTGAPGASERMDVSCAGGALRTLSGGTIAPEEIRGKKVVVHLDGAASQCVLEASRAGVAEVIVGVASDEPGGGLSEASGAAAQAR